MKLTTTDADYISNDIATLQVENANLFKTVAKLEGMVARQQEWIEQRDDDIRRLIERVDDLEADSFGDGYSYDSWTFDDDD